MPRLLSLFLLTCILAPNLQAQDPKPAWGAEADFGSRYIWQGLAYSRGPVFQPSIWVSAKNFTFTLWASQRLNNEPQRGELTELTFSLAYSRTFHKWTIEPTYENWVNRGRGDDSGPNTGVVEVRISHHLGPASLFTDQLLDVQSYKGAYLGDAGVSWEKKVRGIRLSVSSTGGWASAKFNQNYFGPARAAFNMIGSELSATIPVSAHTSLRPHFQWTTLVDPKLRASVSSSDLWSAGLAFGVNF